MNDVINDLRNNHVTVITLGHGNQSHAVAVIGYEGTYSQDRLLIYDSYYGPKKPQTLYLYKSGGKYTGRWNYIVNGRSIHSTSMSRPFLTWTTYSQYYNLWKNRGKLTFTKY